MLSATCLPCLRHLRAIHGGSSAPDDDAERWRYLRPDADFVAQLVSFEHNDSQGPLRDGATRDGGHNSLWVVDPRDLADTMHHRASSGTVHHVRISLEVDVDAKDDLRVVPRLMRSFEILVMLKDAGEPFFADLRTVHLSPSFRHFAEVQHFVTVVETPSERSGRKSKVFYNRDSSRGTPFGATTFMRLAEAGELDG